MKRLETVSRVYGNEWSIEVGGKLRGAGCFPGNTDLKRYLEKLDFQHAISTY
jgi:hypothetical protein